MAISADEVVNKMDGIVKHQDNCIFFYTHAARIG
jgi:hypothetical protein